MKRLILFASILLATCATARAADPFDEPNRAPGRGGTGAAGVPGKGETGTGAPMPQRGHDIDGDGDVDAYDNAMEGSDRDTKAGDAPADDGEAGDDPWQDRYQ